MLVATRPVPARPGARVVSARGSANSKGLPVPLSHNLEAIAAKFPDDIQIPHHSSLDDLTPFASIRRYEEGVAELTDTEVNNAIQVAKDILDWAKGLVS